MQCTNITVVCSQENQAALMALEPSAHYVVQPVTKTGMWGAVLTALEGTTDEPVIIMGNDNCTIQTLQTVCDFVQNNQGAIVVNTVTEYFPGGYIQLQNGKITSIVEKPGAGNEPSNLVNLVIHGHPSSHALVQQLMQVSNQQDDGYEQALDALFKTYSYNTVVYEGNWHPLKYPWHLLTALEHELTTISESSIHPSVNIHESAVITGTVIIGAHTKILPHATIVGPCYIGQHCLVGNNSLVRQSSIGDGCVIGFNSEVKASVLSNLVETHSTYIGDSVIGENVSFGAGSITGNLRLDEQTIYSQVQGELINTFKLKLGVIIGNNCRLGIHTSLAPGIKIGSSTFIGSAVHIQQDVPENSFVRVKNGEVIISKNHTDCPSMLTREVFKKGI